MNKNLCSTQADKQGKKGVETHAVHSIGEKGKEGNKRVKPPLVTLQRYLI